MSQAALLVAVHLLGLAVCLAIGPRQRPALCCALAFPVGLVVTVVIALAVLVVGLPYVAGLVGGASLVLVAAIVVARRRGGAPAVRLALGWTAALALAALLLSRWNVAVMSYDSHQLVKLARVIALDGALDSGTMARLSLWGVFQVIAQSTAIVVGEDVLHALPPLFGLSLVPLFALLLGHAAAAAGAPPGRRRLALVALVTATLFSLHMVGYHLLYLHTNGAAAAYLLGFVALFWLAEVEVDPSLLPLAFVCLTGLALQRTETPMVAVLFLALTVTGSQLPRRAITIGLVGFTAVVALWYLVLSRQVPDGDDFLTPTRCRIMAAGLIGWLLWWLASPWPPIAAINRVMPALVVAVVALALVAALVSRGDHLRRSADVWQHNLRHLPHWGQSWYAIVGLAGLGLGLPPPRFRAVFVIGVPVYMAVMLLLAYGGPGYRVGLGDSANRMTIHVVPLIYFYLGVKLIPVVTRCR